MGIWAKGTAERLPDQEEVEEASSGVIEVVSRMSANRARELITAAREESRGKFGPWVWYLRNVMTYEERQQIEVVLMRMEDGACFLDALFLVAEMGEAARY